ncbi:protein translocase subunit SecD [Janibacter alkaliphilus]|uniref:Protein translocase subunit SecD n=1 Tax=Janibacter alkaliphilus TaxID=1069963 RepID=A0A852X4S1_9MICO|nr:protein translocase subunit SecD [Janibacter alkaliphilus]NYG38036.1 preprotein translocase subunit SecD [Janibacter alkaliphilus]
MARTKVATPKRRDAARRTLLLFFAAVLVLVGILGFGTTRSDAAWTPRLGLDLAGGTQIVLEPRVGDGETVNADQLEQARDIITQRVDAQGTTGAEVTTQGDSNIVVSVPGTLSAEQEEAISASSQMQFRPVLATGVGDPEALAEMMATPSGSATSGSGSGSSSGSGSGSSTSGSGSATSGSGSAPTGSEQPSVSDGATSETSADGGAQSMAATTSPTTGSGSSSGSADDPTGSGSGSETGSGSGSETGSGSGSGTGTGSGAADPAAQEWTPSGEPTGPTDPNNISAELWQQFQDLDCSQDPGEQPVGTDEPIVACDQEGPLKYVLGPVVVPGSEIADATAGYEVTAQGQQTNQPEIQLSFQDSGRDAYADISAEMVQLPQLAQTGTNPPGSYNALATVLDSQVILAPGFNEAIPTGQASISMTDIDEARSIAQTLKFGALPLSFEPQTRQEISPTLGSDQLRYGIIAGIIGLLLVLLYSLAQYRALAVVTIGSMVAAFGLTYLAIVLLAWQYDYRLDMAGVTGLIIAIGVTADSFIVYFERVRDELRDGRNLRAAVEAGWHRAKRTILVADGVNIIAAVVLYVLASSGVRGFAFTLGLTTLIDLAVFWFFTHPMLTLLARNRFFASGHPWSGFDVDRLRAGGMRYTGRGRIEAQEPVEPESSRRANPGVRSDEGAVL